MIIARPIRIRSGRATWRVAARVVAPLLALIAVGAVGANAQGDVPMLTELLATRRVMPDAGPGLRGVCRGPGGNYYVLSAPGAAVSIYDPSGKRVGQVPANPTGTAAIVYGESLAVDTAGRVAVADRGAGGVKIYAADGSLAAFIPVASPESLAFLEGNEGSELAVTSVSAKRLVSVYDDAGRLLREFGDASDVDYVGGGQTPVPARQASMGMVAADASSNIYFVFDYLPDVTLLKYDHLGYAVFDVTSKIPELESPPPAASQSARDEMAEQKAIGVVAPHRVITAVGADPQSQNLWVSSGTLLLHFDKDGRLLASYRTYTPGGGRLEATTILVESDRLILGADPFGLYEFERPDKATH